MAQDIGVVFLLVLLCASAYMRGDDSLYLFVPMLAFYVIALIVRERNSRQRKRFIEKLEKVESDIKSGGTVIVDQLLIRNNTLITSYKANIGLIIYNVIIESNYSIADKHKQLEAYCYSLVSVLSGWWSFPMGPLVTLGLLRVNLSGGDKMTAAELLEKSKADREKKRIELTKLFKKPSKANT